MAWNQNQQTSNDVSGGSNDPPDQSDKYDANVIDEGDLLDQRDMNINPAIYIHQALQRCQVALLNPNVESGLVQYVFLVHNMEIICSSARLINQDEYKKVLDEFKLQEDYKNEKRGLYQQMLLSQEKLRLLLRELFDNKTSSAPLKL